MVDRLIGYPKVLIAAVHGASIGWGCTQLFNFDLVYAHPSAFFQTPFVSLGIVPEGASSYSFPKVMGRQHANRLLLEGDRVPAHDMYVSGLVTKVLEAGSVEAFQAAVCEKAKKIAEFSGESLSMTKRLVTTETLLAEQREAGIKEGHDLRIRFASEDSKASIKKFTDKSGQSSKL